MSKKAIQKKPRVAFLFEVGIFNLCVGIFNAVSNQVFHIGYQKTPLIFLVYTLMGIGFLQITLTLLARKNKLRLHTMYYQLLILVGIPYLIINIFLILGGYILIYCEKVSHICP